MQPASGNMPITPTGASARDPQRGIKAARSFDGYSIPVASRSRIVRRDDVDTGSMLSHVAPPTATTTTSASKPRGRFNRRASTGMCSSNYEKQLNDDDNVGKSEDSEAAKGEQHHGRAVRRNSLSKEESEAKLRRTLTQVHDYKDRSDKVQILKERFSQATPKMTAKQNPRRARRSSLSSYNSQSSELSNDMDPSESSVSRYHSSESFHMSGDTVQAANKVKRHHSGSSLHMSGDTVPVNNVIGSDGDEVKRRQAAKTDQIVESLVWFSFHTPRAVLEDLLSHELDLWRKDRQKKDSLKKKSSRKDKERNAQSRDYKMTYMNLGDDDDDSDEDDGEDDDTGGSVSSLSDNEGIAHEVFGGIFSESMLRLAKSTNGNKMIKLPKAIMRESALLFVDMSGFTKLSTILDVESLSKVINSYFDMIVTEVIQHGGDILKFAGDAFFAEWKVVEDDEVSTGANGKRRKKSKNPLAELTASLASISEMDYDGSVPKLSNCVLSAARCGSAIVKKFSDYQVMSASKSTSEAMLNVHCGIGVGNLVGLHVGDFKEDQEEESVELRREYIILGSPIDQVSRAAEVATDGEVMASPEAMLSLSFCCDVTDEQRESRQPICIASRDQVFLELFPSSYSTPSECDMPSALMPYESLRMHCKSLNHIALARLHLQMALYVHQVIRGDELALSAAIQTGKIAQPTEALERRHRAEAELRSVLTIFVKVIISPRVTGMRAVDDDLYKLLCDIMHVTSRELDRYSGHLRQFIVDDKGVVLIATFGLRGSTFPNMISNNGLPAIFALHRALKSELKVESRIGATFGKVYCGVVGGVRRHEFAVMGAPVNLAARLMSSKVNKGILVDEEVRVQADARYAFNSLPPVTAKGYDKPVAIVEPIENITGGRKRKTSVPFIGRTVEKDSIVSVASDMLNTSSEQQSTMLFLMGEAGMGKSALTKAVVEEIKKMTSKMPNSSKIAVAARSTSAETEQRIPLSSYKKIFMSIVHDLCDLDGSLSLTDGGRSATSSGTGNTSPDAQRIGRFRCAPGLEQHMTEEGRNTQHQGLQKVSREQWGDVFSMKDRVSQSMREIGPLLQGNGNMRQLLRKAETGKRFLPSSANLGHSSHYNDVKTSTPRDGLARSLHRPVTPKPTPKESLGQSLHRLSMARSVSLTGSPKKSHSMKINRSKSLTKDDSSQTSFEASVHTLAKHGVAPYFEKLCWVCEQIQYPYEYADIVGSQFLGLDGANPVTHIEGHVPTMAELSEFLCLVLICIADYADLIVVVLDDFQWVDAFSWKIFQLLSKKWDKLLLLCATRSHDKQALRRLSTAANVQKQRMVEISLGPLDFAEIRQLIARVLDQNESAVTDSFCSDIFQRTGGLPVYVVQVLENVKRKRTVEMDANGHLQWNAEGLKEKRSFSTSKTGVVMEETFLSRFDALDVRVRKVLQTCAVLGLTFSLSDVVKVHPEMEDYDIEMSMDDAVEEMILTEQVEEDDDSVSLKSASTGTADSDAGRTRSTKSTDGNKSPDRFFQFSHAMWRQNVLTTMLKERKIELHRLIAEAMEKDQVSILEQSDISRLLTLFDHWKSCGDFCKTARLALAVGARLEEWDLCAQSLELYEDSLEMAFDTVEQVESDMDSAEWMQVSAKPAVLDFILRLHIRIGLCHQNLGDESDSIRMFEDAYNIIKTTSNLPGMSRSLMMPIISSLCVLKLHRVAYDTRTKLEQEKLVEKFVKEAIEHGNDVHIGRALAMEAGYYARLGKFDRAFQSFERLKSMYDVKANSEEMIAEYSRDFAIECHSEAVQWFYLCEQHADAEGQADLVMNDLLPHLHLTDADTTMYVVFPLIQVLRLIGRAKDADKILKDHVVRPYQEGSSADFWEPIFNPLAYLLDLIIMEDSEEYDEQLLSEIEAWVVDDANHEWISVELEPKAKTLLGEICWRLMDYKDKTDPVREMLLTKARDLLSPSATDTQSEIFLRNTAQALLEAL